MLESVSSLLLYDRERSHVRRLGVDPVTETGSVCGE